MIITLLYPNKKSKSFDLEDSDNSKKIIIHELYYNSAILTDNKITDWLSSITSVIPLYDIYTNSIHLIEEKNVLSYTINYHYRLIDNSLNDNFTKQFNLSILKNSYNSILLQYIDPISNLTSCKRPSFLPICKYLTPYYTKDELINLALNNKLIKEEEAESMRKSNLINERLDNLCKLIRDNDISSNILLSHQIYIQKNNAQRYIKYYSLFGSSEINAYLRNINPIKDRTIENHIYNFYNLINKAPAFDKNYYLYRFITDDNYLENYKKGDIIEEYGFMSTTREPFYQPKNNVFGEILLKIRIPKDKIGIALCIEYYSHFSEEQEILLLPCKLRLIEKNKVKYYHTNKIAEKKIKKKYELEFLEIIDFKKLLKKEYIKREIQYINFDDYRVNSIEDFFSTIQLINNRYVFISDKKEIVINNISRSSYYAKFFYFSKLNYKFSSNNDQIHYMILQDSKIGKIDLFIEIYDNKCSINYYYKYLGESISDIKKYHKFIAQLVLSFNLTSVIIHSNYISYDRILNSNNSLDDYIADTFYYNELLFDFLYNKTSSENIVSNIPKTILDTIFSEKINIFIQKIDNKLIQFIKELLNKKILHDDNNLIDLYLYLHKNYYYMLNDINEYIREIYGVDITNIYNTIDIAKLIKKYYDIDYFTYDTKLLNSL